MDKLREAKRPTSVMFERRITTSNDGLTTHKRPAATDGTSSTNTKIQQPPATKAKAADIIDLA